MTGEPPTGPEPSENEPREPARANPGPSDPPPARNWPPRGDPFEDLPRGILTIEEELQNFLRVNAATLGRLIANGNVGRAEERGDGRMHARVRIPLDELVWDPAVLIMPHGGELELEIINDDENMHSALFPSNGDRQFIWLVNHSRGTATLHLDGPGCYWYNSPTGNDGGRGLTGAIVVMGEVPWEARLDRPQQPRP